MNDERSAVVDLALTVAAAALVGAVSWALRRVLKV